MKIEIGYIAMFYVTIFFHTSSVISQSNLLFQFIAMPSKLNYRQANNFLIKSSIYRKLLRSSKL